MDFLPCGMYSMADSTLPDSVDGHGSLTKKRWVGIYNNKRLYILSKIKRIWGDNKWNMSITVVKIDDFLAAKKVRWREWPPWLGKNGGEDGGPPKNTGWLMLHASELESRRSTWHSVNCGNFCPRYRPTRNCRKSKYWGSPYVT